MTKWATNQLNMLARRVANRWTQANNEGSGRPDHYARLMREANQARDAHDALAARNGLTVSWPGLSPYYLRARA